MTNLKKNKVNVLRGKDIFTIKDFIKILSTLNEDAPVVFGVIEKNSTVFSQDDNLILNLNQNDPEDYFTGEYVVEILTDNISKH
tara:strand:- start:76 stop:327 length:252 start_codon:yes stop_codon:yes gene_type:complete